MIMFSNATRKWMRSGIELGLHGGWAAVIIGYGAYDLDITWAEWRHLIFTGFMGNGGLRAVQYFMNNPLPKGENTGFIAQDGTQILLAPAKVSLNPLAKSQPLVPEIIPPEPPTSDPLSRVP